MLVASFRKNQIKTDKKLVLVFEVLKLYLNYLNIF